MFESTLQPQKTFPVPRRTVETLILAGFLTLNALALRFLAMQRFDPVDYAGFLDAGWRVLNGQKLYSDFIFHAGPVFPYVSALFFKLFGFNKIAILAQLILTNAAAIFLVYAIFRRRIPFNALLLVTACTLAGFHWIYPFPFYTQLAFLWGLSGLAVLVFVLNSGQARHSFFGFLFCGVMTVVTYMTKQTEGVFFGSVYFGLLWVARHKKAGGAGFVAGFSVVVLAFAWVISDLDLFWLNTAVYPMNEKYRFARLINPLSYLQNFYWPVLLVVVPQALRYGLKLRQELFFLIGSAAIGVAAFIMGSLKSVIFAPLFGFCLGFSFLMLGKMEGRAVVLSRRFLWGLGGVFILYAVIFCGGIALSKFRIGGEMMFDVNVPNSYTLQTPGLSGWKTPPNFGADLDSIVAHVQEHIPKDDVLLALRPWVIVYGLTGRKSIRGMETLDMTFKDDAPFYQMLRKQIVDNPPDWILTYKHPKAPQLLMNTTTRQLKLDRWIFENYALVEHWHYAVLFRRNANQPSSLNKKGT